MSSSTNATMNSAIETVQKKQQKLQQMQQKTINLLPLPIQTGLQHIQQHTKNILTYSKRVGMAISTPQDQHMAMLERMHNEVKIISESAIKVSMEIHQLGVQVETVDGELQLDIQKLASEQYQMSNTINQAQQNLSKLSLGDNTPLESNLAALFQQLQNSVQHTISMSNKVKSLDTLTNTAESSVAEINKTLLELTAALQLLTEHFSQA
jgi:hypothetical protein